MGNKEQLIVVYHSIFLIVLQTVDFPKQLEDRVQQFLAVPQISMEHYLEHAIQMVLGP